MVIIDYFSKWLEVKTMKTKTAEECISKLTPIFSTFGIPRIMIADNNPFNSYKMKEFSENWMFSIVTSSPYWARSNGMSERSVQTAKNTLKKILESGNELEIALLENRNTPASYLTLSPSEIMLGRKTSTKLPISTTLLKNVHSDQIARELQEVQNKYKITYDRSAKKAAPFEPGQSVMMQQHDKTWTPAQILNRHSCPRSYMLQNSKGKVYRRNSHYIKKNFNYSKNLNSNINNSKNSLVEDKCFYKFVNIPQRQHIPNPSQYYTRSRRATRPPDRLGFNQP